MKTILSILCFFILNFTLAQVTIEFKLLPGSTKTLNGNIVLCNNTGAALPTGYYIDFFWPGFKIKDLSGAVGSATKPSADVTRLKFETWMLPANGQCKTISVSSESTYAEDFLFPAFGTDSKGNKVNVVVTDPKFIPQSYSSEPKEFYIQKDCFIPSPSSLCLGEAQFEEWNRIADVRVPANRKGWALAAAHAHRMFTNMMGCEVTNLNFSFATSMIEGRMGCDAGFQPPAGDNNPLTYEGHIGVDGCFQIRPLGWVQLEDFYPHIFTNLSKAPITDNGNFITACLAKTLYDYTSFTFWDQYFCYPKVKEFFCNAKDPYAGDAMFAYMYHKGWNHNDFANVFGANRSTWMNSNNVANLLATNFPDINGGYAERVRNNIIRLENNLSVPGGPSLVVQTAKENWDPSNYEYHGCYDAPFTWAEISAYIDEACRVFINADKVAVKAAAKAAFDAINAGAAVNYSKLGSVIDAIVLAIPLPSATKGMAGKYFSQAESCSKGNIRIKSYDKICPGQNAQMNVYLFGVPPFSYSIMAPDGSVFTKSGVNVPTDYYTVNQPGEYKIVSFSDANGPIDLKCNTARTTVENAGNATAKWNKTAVSAGCASGALQIDLTGTAPFTIKYKDAAGVEKTVVINSNTSPYTLIPATVPTGTYVLTHLTAGGCDGPLNDSIKYCSTKCTPPSASITGTASMCAGDSTLITVTLKGTAPFKLKYSNGATKYTKTGIAGNTFTFYAKAAGTYKVDSVWDATCDTLGKGTAIVSLKNSPTLSIGGDTTLCVGGSTNLALTLGGTAPYNIVVSLGAISLPYVSNVSSYNLAVTQPGLYTIQLTDATGCKIIKKVNVITVANPQLNMGNKTLSICNGTTSTLQGIASGGTGGYTYLWSGKASGNTNTFSASSDGLHILQVSDSKGCKDKDTVTISYSAGLTVVVKNDTICSGENTIIESGYSSTNNTFLWNTGSTSSSINASTAGVYSVEVNNNGCKGTGSMTLVVNTLPSIDFAGNNKSICAGNSLVLKPNVTGGDNNYSYQWSNKASGILDSVVATSAGIYTLEVTDGKGCTDRDSVVLTINANLNVQLNNDTICANDSAIIQSGYSGAGYTFLWNTGETTSSIKAKNAGAYSVTVNNNGCSGNGSMSLVVNTLPSIDLGADKNICAGTTVQLNAGATNSNATYEWKNGSTTLSNQATYNASLNGDYILKTIDENGCSASDTIKVNIVASTLNIDFMGNNKSICAGNSIVVKPNVSGGDNNYSYQWSNKGVGTLDSIDVNLAGTYTLEVTDGQGCKDRDSTVVTVSANLNIQLNDTAICEGDSLLISSGYLGNEYTYNWNTGATSASIVAKNSGIYSVLVSNGNCNGKDSMTLTVNALPILDLGKDTSICVGSSITLKAANNFSSYSWNNGLNNTASFTTSLGGKYVLKVSDNNACFASDSISIALIEKPSANVLIDQDLCAGNSYNFNVGSFDNGNGPYTYLWNNNSTASTMNTGNVNSNTWFFVDIADKFGCMGRDSAYVRIKANLPLQIVSNDTILCEGESTVLSTNYLQSNGYIFDWSTGESSESITVNTNANITLNVQDAEGCKGSDAISIALIPMPNTASIVDSIAICQGESALLDAQNSGFNYLWNTAEKTQSITVNKGGKYTVELSKDDCEANATIEVKEVVMPSDFLLNAHQSNIVCFEEKAPIVIGSNVNDNYTYLWNNGETTPSISIEKEGEYILSIQQNNCEAKDTVVFTNFCESSFYVPNSFTPNGDARNDIFKVESTFIQDFEMLIFNRWGELIYTSNNTEEGWNGTYQGNMVQQDVYVYKIIYSVAQENGKKVKKERIGTVSTVY